MGVQQLFNITLYFLQEPLIKHETIRTVLQSNLNNMLTCGDATSLSALPILLSVIPFLIFLHYLFEVFENGPPMIIKTHMFLNLEAFDRFSVSISSDWFSVSPILGARLWCKNSLSEKNMANLFFFCIISMLCKKQSWTNWTSVTDQCNFEICRCSCGAIFNKNKRND